MRLASEFIHPLFVPRENSISIAGVLPAESSLEYVGRYGRWQGQRLQMSERLTSIQLVTRIVGELATQDSTHYIKGISEIAEYVPCIGSFASLVLTGIGGAGYWYRQHRINQDYEKLRGLVRQELRQLKYRKKFLTRTIKLQMKKQGHISLGTLQKILAYEESIHEIMRAINLISTLKNDLLWAKTAVFSLGLSVAAMVIFPPALIGAPLFACSAAFIKPVVTGGMDLIGKGVIAGGYHEDVCREKERDGANSDLKRFDLSLPLRGGQELKSQEKNEEYMHIWKAIEIARARRDARFLAEKQECSSRTNQDLFAAKVFMSTGSMLTMIGIILCATGVLGVLGLIFIVGGLGVQLRASLQAHHVRKRGRLAAAALEAKNRGEIERLKRTHFCPVDIFASKSSGVPVQFTSEIKQGRRNSK